MDFVRKEDFLFDFLEILSGWRRCFLNTSSFVSSQFNSKPKLGGDVIVDKYLEKLQTEIDNEYKIQTVLNEEKKQKYIVSYKFYFSLKKGFKQEPIFSRKRRRTRFQRLKMKPFRFTRRNLKNYLNQAVHVILAKMIWLAIMPELRPKRLSW